MKKIVKLTEADLMKIVKRIIKESDEVDDSFLDEPSPELYQEEIDRLITKLMETYKHNLEIGNIEDEIDVDNFISYMLKKMDNLIDEFREDENMTEEVFTDLYDYQSRAIDDVLNEINYMWQHEKEYRSENN